MYSVEEMVVEIRTELTKGVELDELKDNSGEWVDGYLPTYNSDIIEQWKKMPSEYDDRGAQELGAGEDVTIIRLMTLDLYLYYTDLFNEALTQVEDSLEEVGN
jgi:hypothetical protein